MMQSPKPKKNQREDLLKNREKPLTNKPEVPLKDLSYDEKK